MALKHAGTQSPQREPHWKNIFASTFHRHRLTNSRCACCANWYGTLGRSSWLQELSKTQETSTLCACVWNTVKRKQRGMSCNNGCGARTTGCRRLPRPGERGLRSAEDFVPLYWPFGNTVAISIETPWYALMAGPENSGCLEVQESAPCVPKQAQNCGNGGKLVPRRSAKSIPSLRTLTRDGTTCRLFSIPKVARVPVGTRTAECCAR